MKLTPFVCQERLKDAKFNLSELQADFKSLQR
jgi:hypothetical protein